SDYRPGQHHWTCPQCSAKRSKAHQSLNVLGVKIDADGATWHCNHCGWAGPEKGKGKSNGAGDEFAAIYDDPGFQKVRYPKGHGRGFGSVTATVAAIGNGAPVAPTPACSIAGTRSTKRSRSVAAAATWMMRFRFEKETPHDGKTAQTLAGG